MGLGLVLVLAILGGVRELIGKGSLFSGIEMLIPSARALQVLPADYPGFLIEILPPGAFISLGCIVAAKNWLNARTAARARIQAPA